MCSPMAGGIPGVATGGAATPSHPHPHHPCSLLASTPPLPPFPHRPLPPGPACRPTRPGAPEPLPACFRVVGWGRRPAAASPALEAAPAIAAMLQQALAAGLADVAGCLSGLLAECVAFMAAWPVRAWPTRAFAALPRSLLVGPPGRGGAGSGRVTALADARRSCTTSTTTALHCTALSCVVLLSPPCVASCWQLISRHALRQAVDVPFL